MANISSIYNLCITFTCACLFAHARFYASAAAAMSRAASARETVVLSVANLASSLAAGAVCDACTNIKDTMHAKEALAAEANAKAGRKKRKPRADPKADAAAAEANAKVIEMLGHKL